MSPDGASLKIRRVLLTVSDKEGIVELAHALKDAGAELVATGRTAKVLEEAGLPVTSIEKISGSPEAFQGRMKTLSFPVCSGILYRRGDVSDEADLKKNDIAPIDCVVVNFYPFEKAAERNGVTPQSLIEEIDIGGPTLVRAAAKNSPSVLVLTSPEQYGAVIEALKRSRTVPSQIVEKCAARAWERILEYDTSIAHKLGDSATRTLRYGENPHQKGELRFKSDSPIAWDEPLTAAELSYNNILDLSSAYTLASDLAGLREDSTGVVIVKHNNPCGVALVSGTSEESQKKALLHAWEGDPVSAFGGVIVFTQPLGALAASWLSDRFIEVVAAPGLTVSDPAFQSLAGKRKNLKAVGIRRFGESPKDVSVSVPGGTLFQSADLGLKEVLKSMTRKSWPTNKAVLANFGIAVCRSLKSNAIALVRENEDGFQLVGAGQGQPNRVDALRLLAVPRAQAILSATGGAMNECVMISDAFFPFRDTVDAAHQAGIRYIIQPGGSIKDAESITACNEHGIAMAFTGVRHFKH